jgi:predicted DsbA family dithiol-disulfide isomerase
MESEGQNINEHLSEKYGTTFEDNQRSQDTLSGFGAEHGFTFDFFDNMKVVNTRQAHVLIEYAKTQGKQTEMNLRLIEAFYSERKDISDREVLAQEIEAGGLNSTTALALLDDSQNLKAIETKEQYWQGLGVKSVPTYVFNMKSAVNGAQPVDVFKEVLMELVTGK